MNTTTEPLVIPIEKLVRRFRVHANALHYLTPATELHLGIDATVPKGQGTRITRAGELKAVRTALLNAGMKTLVDLLVREDTIERKLISDTLRDTHVTLAQTHLTQIGTEIREAIRAEVNRIQAQQHTRAAEAGVPDEVEPISPYHVAWGADRTPAEWETLARGLEASSRRHYSQQYRSREECDTDGYLSQWASGANARFASDCAELARAHGYAIQRALFSAETGELVAAKMVEVEDRYRGLGTKLLWCVLADDNPSGPAQRWVSVSRAQTAAGEQRHYRKHGFTVGLVRARVAAYMGGGTSAMTCHKRLDGGFSRDVEIITTVLDDDPQN